MRATVVIAFSPYSGGLIPATVEGARCARKVA
jgi:hypothetical protein